MKKIIIFLFIFINAYSYGQTSKKPFYMYGEPYQYLQRAGKFGMGAFAASGISVIVYSSMVKEPDSYKHPENMLYAGSAVGLILAVGAWRNVQLAGHAMLERERLKVTLLPTGAEVCYKF